MEEERKLPLVEELKKEIQKLQERNQEEDGGGRRMKSGECEAVKKERDTCLQVNTQVSQPEKVQEKKKC